MSADPRTMPLEQLALGPNATHEDRTRWIGLDAVLSQRSRAQRKARAHVAP